MVPLHQALREIQSRISVDRPHPLKSFLSIVYSLKLFDVAPVEIHLIQDEFLFYMITALLAEAINRGWEEMTTRYSRFSPSEVTGGHEIQKLARLLGKENK